MPVTYVSVLGCESATSTGSPTSPSLATSWRSQWLTPHPFSDDMKRWLISMPLKIVESNDHGCVWISEFFTVWMR